MSTVQLWAICNTCKVKHRLHDARNGAMGYWSDWLVKHGADSIYVSAEKDTASAYLVAKLGPNETYVRGD